MSTANLFLKVVNTIVLILILLGIVELIQTVNDKGINMHFYQKISTEHCSWDVETSKGTTINMIGGQNE